GRWPAHTQPRRDGLQRTRRVRIEIEVRFHARDTAPEVDVRLIPNLEVPLRNLINAEVLDQVLRECTDQTIPSLHALRRRYIRLVPERMKIIRIERQLLWHEANLNDRPHSLRNHVLVDLVDIGKVVKRLTVLIFVVHAELIMQN